MLCYTMLYHAMLCYAMICYVMSTMSTVRPRMTEGDNDREMRYGDQLLLWSRTHYHEKKSTGLGGWLGVYVKHNLMAVGPVSEEEKFEPSIFTVLPSTQAGNKKNKGDAVCYEEAVKLVDHQGLVWNNVKTNQWTNGFIAPAKEGDDGEMLVRFFPPLDSTGLIMTPVRYSHTSVILSVMLRDPNAAHPHCRLTVYKRPKSLLEGGYLMCDGSGPYVSFRVVPTSDQKVPAEPSEVRVSLTPLTSKIREPSEPLSPQVVRQASDGEDGKASCAVRYGMGIRLWAKSPFIPTGSVPDEPNHTHCSEDGGGYVGWYHKHDLVALGPNLNQVEYSPSLFTIWPFNPTDDQEVVLGDPVIFLETIEDNKGRDKTKGYAWQRAGLGQTGYFTKGDLSTAVCDPSEVAVSFHLVDDSDHVVPDTEGRKLCFGDRVALLVHMENKGNWQEGMPVTCSKKEKSKMAGGYLRWNNAGKHIIFQVRSAIGGGKGLFPDVLTAPKTPTKSEQPPKKASVPDQPVFERTMTRAQLNRMASKTVLERRKEKEAPHKRSMKDLLPFSPYLLVAAVAGLALLLSSVTPNGRLWRLAMRYPIKYWSGVVAVLVVLAGIVGTEAMFARKERSMSIQRQEEAKQKQKDVENDAEKKKAQEKDKEEEEEDADRSPVKRLHVRAAAATSIPSPATRNLSEEYQKDFQAPNSDPFWAKYKKWQQHWQNREVKLQNDIPTRFVEAEKGNMTEAKKRWDETCRWRLENKVDRILQYPHELYPDFKQNIYAFYHGKANDGCCVYYEKPKAANLAALQAKEAHLPDALAHHFVYHMEYRTQVLDSRELSASLCVVDCDGLGPRDMYGDFVACCRVINAIVGAHYPNRMKCTIVINANWAFTGVWQIVKMFLHPDTLAKVQVHGRSYQKALLEKIEASQLPAIYGGTCECTNPANPSEKSCRFYSKEELTLMEINTKFLQVRKQVYPEACGKCLLACGKCLLLLTYLLTN
eukprot:g14244.t1